MLEEELKEVVFTFAFEPSPFASFSPLEASAAQHQPFNGSSGAGVGQAIVGQWAHEDRIRTREIRAQHIREDLIADHRHMLRLELHLRNSASEGSGERFASGAATTDRSNLEHF